MSYLKETIVLESQEVTLGVMESLQRFPKWQRSTLVVALIAIIPGFYLTRFITESILTRQYAQYVITAKPSFANAKDVALGPVVVLPVSPGVFSAYATVQNPNLDVSANQASYQFTFVNAQGEQVYTKSGLVALLPNQKSFLVIPKISSPSGVRTGTVKIITVRWQKRSDVAQVQLDAPPPLLKNVVNPASFNLEGSVTNRSPYDIKTVNLIFLLKDSSGTIVAVSSRDEFALRRNERRAYVQPWPGLASTVITTVEVLPSTNVLDPANLTGGALNSGSDLGHPNTK